MVDEGQVRALRLNATRNGIGAWTIEFTNLWLPRDLHQFQMAISREYRQYRRDLVDGLKKSRKRVKDEDTRKKIEDREEKREEEKRDTPSEKGFDLEKGSKIKIKVTEKKGINKERAS